MSLLDSASLIVTPNGFTAGKLYSIVPATGAGDFGVTRATTATRVNSSGLIESVASNIPRLDYSNGSCPSILVEPQRTNLLLRSEEFESAAWTKANVSVSANTTTAPNGTLTADSIIENSALSTHVILQSVTLSATTYTYSVYVKSISGSSRNVGILLNSTGKGVLINPTNGSVVSYFGTTSADVTITSDTNGWFRVSLTATTAAITESIRIYLGIGTTWTAPYQGDGTSGAYIWGAQLEAGAYPTSYIPTTSASVTRNADVISKTGISSLIGQTEGTIFFDGVINGCQNSSANILNSERNTTASFYISYIKSTSRIVAGIFSSGTEPATFQSGSVAIGSRFKVAYAYKSGSNALYVNGTLIASNTNTFTLPSTLDDIYIGDQTTYFSFGESIRNNATSLWKERLTNDQLATLTTL
jgi:hypothetical protein